MKCYLNTEQIIELIRKSSEPIWRMGALAMVGGEWFDLLSVSPIGLIYFRGNSDTGWQHIQERHSHFSETNYFGNGSQRNPSKFKINSIPINDYRNVADDVFTFGFKDGKDHPSDSLFDKYKGKSKRYIDSDGNEVLFHLVLYKNSKIVHSLYPDKNLDYKPKRILKEYAPSTKDLVAKLSLGNGYHHIEIPFIDRFNVIRYIVIFRINSTDYFVDFHLQVNSKLGKPMFTTYEPLFNFSMGLTDIDFLPDNFVRLMNGVSRMDLTLMEREILSIDKYLNSL